MCISADELRAQVDSLRRKANDKILVLEDAGRLHTLIADTSGFVGQSGKTFESENREISNLEGLIFGFIRHLYGATLLEYLDVFRQFLLAPEQYPSDHKNKFFYPVFEIYVRNPTIGGPYAKRETSETYELLPHGYVTEPGMYEATITCPRLYKRYLQRHIRMLLKNHAPVVRVRPSVVPIPIHFAVGAYELGECGRAIDLPVEKMDVSVVNRIPLHFDVPKLANIEDIAKTRRTETFKIPSLEFINDVFFRGDVKIASIVEEAIRIKSSKVQNANDTSDNHIIGAILNRQIAMKREGNNVYDVNQLSLFAADRVDYSLGRIGHYTKTHPADFQNFTIFTNYQMYVEEFLRHSFSHIIVRAILRDGALCDLREVLNKLNTEGLSVTERQLLALNEEDVQLSVPLDKRDGRNRDGSNPFGHRLTVSWLAESGILREFKLLPAHRAPDAKLVPGNSALDACFRLCIRSVIPEGHDLARGGWLKGSELGETEWVLTEIIQRAIARFIGTRMATGITGSKFPQMPAYHLIRDGCAGISMVNIGVGPSNAKTMTDHLAVLRPHVWLMLGHCAGVRATQQLGHYVLADGYFRADGVLDRQCERELPIPSIGEIHEELIRAFNAITGQVYPKETMSPLIRTGSVATVMDRNWELTYPDPKLPLESGKIIGLDMESATVACNGFRYSVPYAAFLCVSDRPLHGDLKLEGMADRFYRDAVKGHFRIAIRAMEKLCAAYSSDGIRTRKLRQRQQPPFQ